MILTTAVPDSSTEESSEEHEKAIKKRLSTITRAPWRVVICKHELSEAGEAEFPGWEYPDEHQIETDWDHPQLKGPVPIPWLTTSPYRKNVHSVKFEPADAEFIANAPTDMAWLLEKLSSVPAQIEAAVNEESEICATQMDMLAYRCKDDIIAEPFRVAAAAIRARGKAK